MNKKFVISECSKSIFSWLRSVTVSPGTNYGITEHCWCIASHHRAMPTNCTMEMNRAVCKDGRDHSTRDSRPEIDRIRLDFF